MDGPGEYIRDVTEGITPVEDRPEPKTRKCSRNYKRRPCPDCGHSCYRDRVVTRTLHGLGDVKGNRPIVVKVTYSQHHCSCCDRYFNANTEDRALPKARYTHNVVAMAVRLVVEDGLAYRMASWHVWRDHRVFVPFATIQNWVDAGGKKSSTPYRHCVS